MVTVGPKRRELAQHAHTHVDRTHSLYSHTYINTVTTTWREAPAQLLLSSACWVYGVSVIHRTLTWTTGSVSCACHHSCACVYTRGLGTPTACQHNVFDSEKLQKKSSAPDGIRTPVLWILSPTLYQYPVVTAHRHSDGI